MSTNPYQATETNGQPALTYQRISATPIEYLKQSYELIQSNYMLFLGITFCGFLLGSLAPMGILMGPMFVGIFMCFLAQESTGKVKFDILFKGFDQFVPSLLVVLIMIGCNLAATLVCGLIMLVCFLVIIGIAQTGFSPEALGVISIGGFVLGYGLLIVVSILSVVPFAFCFQLIAEHKMSTSDAVRTSARAVRHNLMPLALTYVSFSFISFLAALLCYVPLILLLPIQIGASFIIYRQVFPRQNATASVEDQTSHGQFEDPA